MQMLAPQSSHHTFTEEGLLDSFLSKPPVDINPDTTFRELFGIDPHEQFPLSIHDLARLQGELVDAARNPGHVLRRHYSTDSLTALINKITNGQRELLMGVNTKQFAERCVGIDVNRWF